MTIHGSEENGCAVLLINQVGISFAEKQVLAKIYIAHFCSNMESCFAFNLMII